MLHYKKNWKNFVLVRNVASNVSKSNKRRDCPAAQPAEKRSLSFAPCDNEPTVLGIGQWAQCVAGEHGMSRVDCLQTWALGGISKAQAISWHGTLFHLLDS